MGNCAGGEEDGVPKKTDKNTISVLILGVSGCGKSTFAKQMKILHLNGFADFEIDNYKKIIVKNMSNGLHELMSLVEEAEGEVEIDEDNMEAMEMFLENPSVTFDEDIVDMAKDLWEDAGVKKIWKKHRYAMHYSHLDYYMEHIDRITSDDYIPEHEEIIRSRQYTIGASTTSFFLEKHWWTLIDVGGQTPERAKWTAIVQDRTINALLFFAALDDFDTESAEDPSKTRYDVSLDVWKDVTTSGHFSRDSTILFLNKLDLFENQIKDKRLFKAFKKRFKKYKGGQDVDEAIEFIKGHFKRASRDPDAEEEEEIYIHATCAIDTNQMGVVWQTIRKTIVQQRSQKAGMYI